MSNPPTATPTIQQEPSSKPDLVSVRSSLKFLKKKNQNENEEQTNQDVASVGDVEVIVPQENIVSTEHKETPKVSKVKAGAKSSSAIIASKSSR